MTPPDQPPDDPLPSGRSEGYAVDWATRANAVGEVLDELSRQNTRCRRRRLILAGAAAVLAGVLALRFSPRWSWSSAAPAATVASLPERRVLPDGSIVELKDDAAIVVAFKAPSPGPRRVTLQRGEAHFSVAKDKERPFIVTAGGIEVRAVGTAFTVQLDSKQVEVLVTEGRVVVDNPPPEKPPTGDASAQPQGLTATAHTIATVDAGNRVVVPVAIGAGTELAAGRVQTVTSEEMDERMAWRMPGRESRLEFSGTPLSEAVAMLNQRNEIKFILADPALGRLQISGFLRADETETFVLLLETDFGIKAEHRGPYEIILSRP